jgi:hypothetical protein
MGNYYGYNGGGNQVSFFKPLLGKNGNHFLETKNGNTSLSCSGSCKVIKIEYVNGVSYMPGFPVDTYGEKYILRNDSSIDGMAMSDLLGGCMNSAVNNELMTVKINNEKDVEMKTKEENKLKTRYFGEITDRLYLSDSEPGTNNVCRIKVHLNRGGGIIGNPVILGECHGMNLSTAISNVEASFPIIPPKIPYKMYHVVILNYQY